MPSHSEECRLLRIVELTAGNPGGQYRVDEWIIRDNQTVDNTFAQVSVSADPPPPFDLIFAAARASGYDLDRLWLTTDMDYLIKEFIDAKDPTKPSTPTVLAHFSKADGGLSEPGWAFKEDQLMGDLLRTIGTFYLTPQRE